eukprot:TRINITY_DN1047_c0_g1_i10.p1 TRINITY_DN1047_c0_g1~~TRINITY_DN1047_c0_g1_i10.p1  ORF type:complete len:215 (+),score=44.85 TRINITY_DN1047_c0_g1_i10:145-789(+)
MGSLAAIKNDNLVQLIDIKKTASSIYIIMEYCSGGNLKSYIEKNGTNMTLPEAEACRILNDILQGFRVLVSKSMVHRDIKRENILLSGGKWKIADFGFSKQLRDNEVRTSTLVGSPYFMAPQISGMEGDYTNKCDIWSLGVLLYNLLYGKFPWTGRDLYELSDNIRANPLAFPDTPAVSEKTKDIIKRMLQVEEADRIESVSYTHLTLPTIYSV